MRRLHPTPTEDLPLLADVYRAYRPADPAGPLVRINMVSSADGHIADADGVSGSLGGDGDLMAFRAMRNLADGILVGAGTARAEDYGPMRVSDELRELREADGRAGPAPIIVVTSSGRLDVGGRLFEGPLKPTVLTCENCPDDSLTRLRDAGATVVIAGEGQVDLARGLEVLRRDHGLAHVLCEGGPSLNGDMFNARVVDEVCLTVSPTLAGGADAKRVVDGLEQRTDLQLGMVLEHGGELLLRYTVAGEQRD